MDLSFIFLANDEREFGLTVALVGIMVVFSSLILLSVIFFNLPRLFKLKRKQRMKRSGKTMNGDCCVDITGETSAAIAMAIHMHFSELHDKENMVVTIKKVSKRYSPWSSKIYGLNNYYFKK